jgi:hypothetical protein
MVRAGSRIKGVPAGRVEANRSRAYSNHASPGDELDDQHYDSDDQQQVNEASGEVETEAQKPQNEKNDKNCPEHAQSPLRLKGDPRGSSAAQPPA